MITYNEWSGADQSILYSQTFALHVPSVCYRLILAVRGWLVALEGMGVSEDVGYKFFSTRIGSQEILDAIMFRVNECRLV